MLVRSSSRILVFVFFMVLLIQLVHGQDSEGSENDGVQKIDYCDPEVDDCEPEEDDCDPEKDVCDSELSEKDIEKMERQCPENYMEYYKDCKGAIQQCSQCLQKAERECRVQEIQDEYNRGYGNQIAVNGTCNGCRMIYGKKCDRVKPMCFGYQDCNQGDGSMHCVNFECVE